MNSGDGLEKALQGISLNDLPVEKVFECFALGPALSPEVMKKLIGQFPELRKMAAGALSVMENGHAATLKSNEQSQKEVFQAYGRVDESLSELLKRDDLDWEQIKFLIERKERNADRVSEEDAKNKQFLAGRHNKLVFSAAAVLVAAVWFVGGRVAVQNATKAVA
ncbi:hypothetical protein AB0L34_29295 [Micromonospora sp. NPDC052213]|uniref:hypothetical protein n=1 Tax=Micromonospora sp. NPDC052213 TaxID=3155812 RepID=UPI00342C6B0F